MVKTARKNIEPVCPEKLFQPFDQSPPDGDACLDLVYKAFDGWPIEWRWCSQCFAPGYEERLRRFPDIRTAPHDAFDAIFFEHPGCSGGPSTFLHCLPRGLELSFFDHRIYPDFGSLIARFGALAWPEKLLAPLRQLLCRASINWFTRGETNPLQRLKFENHPMSDRLIGPALIGALCVVRTEPRSIAKWLLEIDTPNAWRTVLDFLRSERAMDNVGYFVLPDATWEEEFDQAYAALERQLRDALHEIFDDEVLLAKWERSLASDPQLAELISETEWMRQLYRVVQTPDERTADNELLSRAIARPVLS